VLINILSSGSDVGTIFAIIFGILCLIMGAAGGTLYTRREQLLCFAKDTINNQKPSQKAELENL
jgi:hypothetical protein